MDKVAPLDVISSVFPQSPVTEEVTDVVSFYHLPSTIVKHPTHRTLYVAYSFYNVALTTPLKDLILDALIIAKKVSSHSMHLEHVNLPSLPSPPLPFPLLPSPPLLSWDLMCSMHWM